MCHTKDLRVGAGRWIHVGRENTDADPSTETGRVVTQSCPHSFGRSLLLGADQETIPDLLCWQFHCSGNRKPVKECSLTHLKESGWKQKNYRDLKIRWVYPLGIHKNGQGEYKPTLPPALGKELKEISYVASYASAVSPGIFSQSTVPP